MSHESTQIKQDLLAAAEAALAPREPEAGHGGTASHRSRTRLVTSSLTLLALLGTYVFVLRPEWVFPPAPLVESPALSEASLRLALVRERQLVEAHLRQYGQLPRSLAETGGRLPGATLTPGAGTSFVVAVPLGPGLLELSSSDPLELFLGNSLEIIRSRTKDQ